MKLLNELANSLSTYVSNSRASVELNTSETIQNADVIDEPKVLNMPAKTFMSCAVDAASTNILTASNEIAFSLGVVGSSKIVTYPSFTSTNFEVPFIGTLFGYKSEGVTDSYLMLNSRYVDDPELPTGAIAHDVRIFLESYMIEKAVDAIPSGTILMIDGPIYYPSYHPKIVCKWNNELAKLNEFRVDMIRKSFKYGLTPLNIVKRIRDSYYIPQSITGGKSDINYVERLISNLGIKSKPIRTPIYLYQLGEGPARCFTYVAVPKSSIYGSHSIFRVEILKEIYDDAGHEFVDELVSYVAFEALNYGLGLPYRLTITDSYSKNMLSKMANIFINMLAVRGISVPYEVFEYGG
ncbi:MAG: DNA double-strand break repair nuclease NurA [Sulfolobales archaeon]